MQKLTTYAATLTCMGLVLAGCAPMPDARGDTAGAADSLEARPNKRLLYQFNATSDNDSLPFTFTCAASASATCSIQVALRFDEQTLHQAKQLGVDENGDQSLLSLNIVACAPDRGQCGRKASFGWSHNGAELSSVYTARDLRPGSYQVMIIRADLPRHGYELMPVQVCVGGAADGCADLARSVSPRAGVLISGSISRWTTIDVLLGTGSFSAAVAEDVELLRADGSAFGSPIKTSTDGDGAWSIGDVLPGSYKLLVAGSIYPITVRSGGAQRMNEIQL